jgi:peptide/nickel transport system permease protein
MERRSLILFVGRRITALAGLLVALSFGVFTLLYLAPGSPEQVLIGVRPVDPEALEALRERHNLNDPFLIQYLEWLAGAVQLDFGRSIRTSDTVVGMILDRLGLTVFLGVFGFLIAMGLGVPLGVLAAVKRRRSIDRIAVGLSLAGVSAPPFATGIFLLYVFAVLLDWFPAFGSGSGFLDRLWHLTLPAVALALTAMALIVKLTRAAMIEELERDYVAFAFARGLRWPRVLFAYALRNALVPIVTAGGLVLGYMLAGAVLIEVTFALPGLGLLLVESVTATDIPVVQGLTMLVAIVIVVVNLVTDVVYMLIDPRIRFEAVAA